MEESLGSRLISVRDSLLYMSGTNSETDCSTLLLVVMNIMTKCNWEERVYLAPTLCSQQFINEKSG